jgi:hypothetical protein
MDWLARGPILAPFQAGPHDPILRATAHSCEGSYRQNPQNRNDPQKPQNRNDPRTRRIETIHKNSQNRNDSQETRRIERDPRNPQNRARSKEPAESRAISCGCGCPAIGRAGGNRRTASAQRSPSASWCSSSLRMITKGLPSALSRSRRRAIGANEPPARHRESRSARDAYRHQRIPANEEQLLPIRPGSEAAPAARELASTLRVRKARQVDFVPLRGIVAERSQRPSRDSTGSRFVAFRSLATAFGAGLRQVHVDDVGTAAAAERGRSPATPPHVRGL